VPRSSRSLANEIIGPLAHRAAEYDRAGMAIQRFEAGRQTATPDISLCPSARNALPTRPGVEVSVQDDQHR
jgi:hypothetical protein